MWIFLCKHPTSEFCYISKYRISFNIASVENSLNITSLDAAQVDSISGTHQAGYNNDNVDVISIYEKGNINYFPRGLNNLFKNIRGIQIAGLGLKEVHQSDLKDFPDLTYLSLSSNNLEILEEN